MATTRQFTPEQLDHEIDLYPGSDSCLANIEGEAHRWYRVRHLVFKYEGLYWSVEYHEPASEDQEDQDRWSTGLDRTVTAVQVRETNVLAKAWVPVDVSPSAEQDGWIPCEGVDNPKLPKPYTMVVIHDQFYCGVTVGCYDNAGWTRFPSGSDDVGVTHWRPLELPDPPAGVPTP